MKSLNFYVNALAKLKVDRAHGIAPHKPILLLSIIELIEHNQIESNKIFITPELVSQFRIYWNSLVYSNHNERFSLPFYHLKSDGFWTLKPKIGYEKILDMKSSMRSFQNLNLAVDYAEIDSDFFELSQNKTSRDIFRQVILENFLPLSIEKFNNIGSPKNDYLNKISSEILEDNSSTYREKIIKLENKLDLYEEEIFIRSYIFKREISRVYNNTCCISDLNVDAIDNISMIDACHIVPFSESYDDTITNGIALCPNLHRAFDRGLISIDKNYRVLSTQP